MDTKQVVSGLASVILSLCLVPIDTVFILIANILFPHNRSYHILHWITMNLLSNDKNKSIYFKVSSQLYIWHFYQLYYSAVVRWWRIHMEEYPFLQLRRIWIWACIVTRWAWIRLRYFHGHDPENKIVFEWVKTLKYSLALMQSWTGLASEKLSL